MYVDVAAFCIPLGIFTDTDLQKIILEHCLISFATFVC